MLVQIYNIGHSINSEGPNIVLINPATRALHQQDIVLVQFRRRAKRQGHDMSPKLDEMLDVSKITEKKPLTFYRDLFTDL